MRVVLLEVPPPSFRLLRRTGPAVALLVLVALSYDTGVLDLASTKVAAFQAIVALWAVVAVLLALRDPEQRPAFGLALLVTAWAIGPSIARGLAVTHVLGKPIYLGCLALAYVLMRRSLRHPIGWPGLVWTLTALSLVFSTSAIFEVLVWGGDPNFSGAPVTTLGNPNHLGALLVLCLPAVLAASDGQARLARAAVLTIAVTSVVAIVLTGSHLALLGASGVLGVVAANPGAPRRVRFALVGLLVGVLVIAVVARPWLISDPQEATSEVAVDAPAEARHMGERGPLRALQGRLYMARLGVAVVAEQPLLGVGMGEYPWGFAAEQADYLEENPSEERFHTRLQHAHNDAIELLAEVGVVGVLALLIGVWWLRRLAKRSPAPEDDEEALAGMTPAFALTGLLLFAAMSLGHFVLFDPPSAAIAVAYLACLGGNRVRVHPTLARALAVIVLLGAVAVLAATLRTYMAEHLVVDGLEAMEAGDLRRADAALADAQARFPSGEVLFYRGTVRMLEHDLDEAIPLLQGAAYLLPYAEVHMNLGLALCQAGYEDEALERLHQAVRLDPTMAAPREALAKCSQR